MYFDAMAPRETSPQPAEQRRVGLDRWIPVVTAEMRNPAMTNEDITWTACQYFHAAQKSIVARMESGRAETLGGETRMFSMSSERQLWRPLAGLLKQGSDQ